LTKSIGKSGLLQHQQEHLDTSRPTGEEVTSITFVSKGFFCLIGGKRLCLYSKIGDSWDFAKTREYIIPNNDISRSQSSISYVPASEVSSDRQPTLVSGNQAMWKIAVSSKEEHVLVLTSKQQIYSVSDMAKDHSAESKVNLLIYLLEIFFFYFVY